MGNRSEAEFSYIAEIIGSNQDLVTEILLRLPAQSLVKFQCVSKLWFSIISDPKFRFSHARLQKILNPTPTSLLFIKGSYSSAPEFDIIPIIKDDDHAVSRPELVGLFDFLNFSLFSIINSCNGLFLCCDDDSMRFSVCNPITREYKILGLPVEEHCALARSLCLAYDPLTSPHYKVISFYLIDTDQETYFIYVYSSETDSWSMLESSCLLPLPYLMDYDSGVFCNGAIHWFSYGDSSLYFDVDNETLKTMPMPAPPISSTKRKHCNIMYFEESRGQYLLMARQSSDHSYFEFDVLEMQASDYSGWSLRYHVNLIESMRPVFPELITDMRLRTFLVLTMIKGGEKEDEGLTAVIVVDHEDIPYRALSYNLTDDGIPTKICDLQRPSSSARSMPIYAEDHIYAYPYFQSLIRL